MEPARVSGEDLAEALGAEPERLWAEVLELALRRARLEQPDPSSLSRSSLRQHQLGPAFEHEPEGRRFRTLFRSEQPAEPPRGHQVYEQHQLLVLGRKQEALTPTLDAPKAASLESTQRGVVRLQRGDVSGPGLGDGGYLDRLVQGAPQRLHLWKLRHRAVAEQGRAPRARRSVPEPTPASRAAGGSGAATAAGRRGSRLRRRRAASAGDQSRPRACRRARSRPAAV